MDPRSDGQCVHGLNDYSLYHAVIQLLIIPAKFIFPVSGKNLYYDKEIAILFINIFLFVILVRFYPKFNLKPLFGRNDMCV